MSYTAEKAWKSRESRVWTTQNEQSNSLTLDRDDWPSPANQAIISTIISFGELPDDWDSYGALAPDESVVTCAYGAVIALDQHKITVTRATPGAGNNIELRFQFEGALVRVEIDDEEWQVAIERVGQPTQYQTIEPSVAKNVHALLTRV